VVSLAYIKAYDALGGGLNIRSGTFVSGPSTTLTLTYSDITDYDFDTAFIYEEYNDGLVTFGAFADWLGGTMFSLNALTYWDSSDRILVEAFGLNLVFDSTDDFSNGVLFINMFSGSDTIIGNRYADYIELGLSRDKGVGNGGNDRIFGEAGNDTLIGGSGNDILGGGSGIDRFVFATNCDKDRVNDFDAIGRDHDVIDLRVLNSIGSFADLRANHMTKSGANVVINGGSGDVITLVGVTLSSLDAGDFLI
jgi:Ca2+-binding RTX toxin-like protein